MTERKTTGASPLIDIIKEVYDTKKRMKKVINTVIETNSDDFEEYATLTTNVLVKKYNEGYKDGYIDGWHVIFPDDTVEEEDYEEGFKPYASFTPTVPTYSTDTYIDNLVDIMSDNLRCRLLLKTALETNSNEFVTYPDLLELGIENSYDDGYNTGYDDALQKATDLSYGTPTIIHVAGTTTVKIISNSMVDGTTLYYWIGTSAERIEYTGEFDLEHSAVVNAANFLNNRIGPVAKKFCDVTDYSAVDYVKVSLPVGQTSAEFTATAIDIPSSVVYIGYYYAQYSYDFDTWYDIPFTSEYKLLKSFHLTNAQPEVYFRFNDYFADKAIISFTSYNVYDEISYQEAPAGSTIHDTYGYDWYYVVSQRALDNPNPVDISGHETYVYKSSNSTYYKQYGVRGLAINSAQYLYLDLHEVPMPSSVGNDYNAIYNDLFDGNDYVKTPPDILGYGDFTNMYRGCYNINYIGAFINPRDPSMYTQNQIANVNELSGWVDGVAASGTFVKHPYYSWPTGTSGIPSGWTVVDAPLFEDDSINHAEITRTGNTITITNPNVAPIIGWGLLGEIFYWTSEDSTPTKYTNPITIDDTITLYAQIVVNNRVSPLETQVCAYEYTPAAPTVSQDNNTITITNNEGEGVIYYSLDGENYITYNGPFTVDDTYTITVKCDTSELHPTWAGNVSTITYTNIYYLNYAPTLTVDGLTFTLTNNDPNNKGTLYYTINGGNAVAYTGQVTFDLYTDTIVAYYSYAGQVSPNATYNTDFGLRITFPDGNGTVKLNGTNNNNIGKYKLNDNDWAECNDTQEFSNVNTIIFRDFTYRWNNTSTGYEKSLFTINQRFAVSGYYERIQRVQLGSVTGRQAGCAFYNNTYLYDASSLILPRTYIYESDPQYNVFECQQMFKGCTNLVSAPQLPETTLTGGCYGAMFSGCTALTSAPSLPATTLTAGCYGLMFSGCTALTSAPSLPATTLTRGCYSGMFNGCTALTSAPSLPATTLTRDCYSGMFKGCTSLENGATLAATTLPDNCYESMYEGCSSLITEFTFSVTGSVGSSSCKNMFNGCSSLTKANGMFRTSGMGANCFESMFYGCTSLTAGLSEISGSMGEYSCKGMYEGCTSLTTGVSTLSSGNNANIYCCDRMYYGCTSLTTCNVQINPPQTAGIYGCYHSMFEGCSSLTTAPRIMTGNAIAGSLYGSMFRGCSSLATIYCLTDFYSGNFSSWVYGVAANGTFYKKSTETWPTGTNGIPSGWTVVNAA